MVVTSSSLVLSNAATAVGADAAGSPYQGIVDRNVFNLKPPPPAVPPEPPAPPPPKIILTGITTILGPKQAMMMLQLPPRPPEPAKQESLRLGEGEKKGQIEVVSIDQVARTVTVKNHGQTQTLTFEKDGAKLVASAAAPATLPGIVPPPVQNLQNPALRNPRQIPNIPQRMVRMPADPNAPNPGGVTPGQGTATPPAAPSMTPEEQVIMIEVERQRTRGQVESGELPPLPPTELTPEGSIGMPAPQ